jgi:hypothetical protein
VREQESFIVLATQGKKARGGVKLVGRHAGLSDSCGGELRLWIGDATEIARKRERKQKTDRQDAQHILQLL